MNRNTPLWIIVAVIGAILGIAVFIISICVNGMSGWVPGSWEHLYYFVAILALFVGALWANYTWNHSEALRQAREIPGMELDMEFREQQLANGIILIDIRTTAKNTSVIPIRVDLKGLKIRIEKRPLPAPNTLQAKESGHVILDQVVDTQGIKELTLEPMTTTIFTEYFAAEPDALYAVKFSIPYEGHDWIWDRIHLHYVQSRTSS